MSKSTVYAVATFSGILVFWAATNLLLAQFGNMFRQQAPQVYLWLLMADWVIGLGIAVLAACLVYRHSAG